MTEQSFDPQRFKNEQRRDWDVAAAGWKKWWPVFERAAQHVSDRLVELAGIKQGARVLDIATGNGEPAVTAARKVGAMGRVIATDQSAGHRPRQPRLRGHGDRSRGQQQRHPP